MIQTGFLFGLVLLHGTVLFGLGLLSDRKTGLLILFVGDIRPLTFLLGPKQNKTKEKKESFGKDLRSGTGYHRVNGLHHHTTRRLQDSLLSGEVCILDSSPRGQHVSHPPEG